jgi:hypothetical protein
VCAQLERYGVGVRGDRIVRVEGRTHLEWLVFRRGQRVRCAGLGRSRFLWTLDKKELTSDRDDDGDAANG